MIIARKKPFSVGCDGQRYQKLSEKLSEKGDREGQSPSRSSLPAAARQAGKGWLGGGGGGGRPPHTTHSCIGSYE